MDEIKKKKLLQIYYDCRQKQTLGFISICSQLISPQKSTVYFLITFSLNCPQDKQYWVDNTGNPFLTNCM